MLVLRVMFASVDVGYAALGWAGWWVVSWSVGLW
jgi:hypothetical protein